MNENTSLFGFQCDDPASRAAYDMMVLDDMGLLDGDKGDETEDAPISFSRRWF